MATDKLQGNQTPKWADRNAIPGQRLDAATYIGVVKNNIDPTRSGRLQVWIPEFGASQNEVESNPTFWRTVNYASPYFGSTYQPEASKNNTFDNSNQTYGMWMVPPDIGNQVLCTFVNGDPNRGFWFACINPTLSHYMVPGMAAGNKVANASPAISASIIKNSQPPQSLPVTEFNENQPDAINGNFYENPKPVHDFQANILFKQGLDRDSTRGAITSSSQRESPSQVFGISTPGRPLNDPADDPTYVEKLASGTLTDADLAIKVRKGGHQFVMDDGDVLGNDQLMRLRSAGGHQILMHDSKKTMYIANSEGSVWIELSESGHMHIYTAGGFNLRTEGELNMHAKTIKMQSEGDVNIAAGGGFNVSGSTVSLTGTNGALLYGGKVNIGSNGSMTIGASKLTVGASGAITIDGSTIDLNNGGGGNSIGPAVLQAYKHDDTTYDEKTRLWMPVVQGASSIVSIMPAHEPWARSASTLGAAPTKQVENSICPPKSGTPGSMMSGTNFVGGAGPFGDWIARNETGSYGAPGGYNAFNRGGPAARGTGSIAGEKIEFTSMTIEEVQTLQASTDPYKRVFACGRYQVIPETLAAAVRALKIPSNQLFNQETQDYIFNNYLCNIKRPPIAAYLNNPDPNNEALLKAATLSTAQEWASIGVPAGIPNKKGNVSDGTVSYYAGDGVNKAHGTADQNYAALKAQWQYLKDQKSGTLVTSSGAAVTDGSNNPVKTDAGSTDGASTDKKDIGITNAAGKAMVGENCPAEYLGKDTAYTPPEPISSGKPLLNQNHAKAMHAELAYMESKWAYDLVKDPSSDGDGTATTEAVNIGPRIGKYQVDAPYLADESRAYIKADAVTQYKAGALANDASWTGKDKVNSQAAFKEFKSVQDDIQFKEFKENFVALKANGGIKDDDDICIAAGMLFVAHQMRSVEKAKEWREKGDLTDVKGVPGEVYFNHGRYAIDILSAGAGAPTPAGGANGGENTSGVNPDDVFTFTSGSGSRASFDSLNGEFKTQVCKMAQMYKEKTGSRIQVTSAVRSIEQQQVLYDSWVAGGGRIPDKPTVQTPNGSITTPAKPGNNVHTNGIALDATQMNLVVSTLGASTISGLGLKWGGTFSTPDVVHVQLASAPKPTSTPVEKPTLPKSGGIVVVGDSIAAGTGASLQQLDSSVKVSARVGAGSSEILSTWVPPVTGAKVAIVSAGSNDIVEAYPSSQTAQAVANLVGKLEAIRSALGAEQYIWILPNFNIAQRAVANFASSKGDQTVSFAPSRDNVHPANYATVANNIKGLL